MSYDAFRNEYFDRGVSNFTNSLRQNSTTAHYMRNVFPTKTFPNHHSIATGVYAEKHGVTGNQFYDFELQKSFNYSFEMFHYRSEIKPIWTLNELAGGYSGCMMWPGSDYYYDGIPCTHSQHYNQSEDFNERVDQVFKWILDPKYPANLVMFYIEEPDLHAHAYGPESQKITDLVERLDKATEYLHKKIYEYNLQNRINVIHVSDHGMDSLQLKNVIDLRKIVSEKVKYYGTTPILQIVPDYASERDVIYKKLLNASKILKTFNVYLNEDLPERWHFNNKDRVGPITVLANLGYGFHDMYEAAKWYEQAYNIPVNNENKYGVHGYDNQYESMHPIFFAYGNKIKNNNVVDPFDSVDLMYLFCEILGLSPPSNLMGKRENILPILKDSGFHKLPRWIVLSEFTLKLFFQLIITLTNFNFLFTAGSLILSTIIVSTIMISLRVYRRNQMNVPAYLYHEDDTTILDDKMTGSINSNPSQSTTFAPSSSFNVA